MGSGRPRSGGPGTPRVGCVLLLPPLEARARQRQPEVWAQLSVGSWKTQPFPATLPRCPRSSKVWVWGGSRAREQPEVRGTHGPTYLQYPHLVPPSKMNPLGTAP